MSVGIPTRGPADKAAPSLTTTPTPPSHRPALMAFHDIVLSLDGEGGWSLHPGHRTLEAKQAAAAQLAAAGNDSEFDARFAVPPPPRPTATPDGTDGKARGSDADAVLHGMTGGGGVKHRRRRRRGHGKEKANEGEEELGDGNEGFAGAAGGQACLRALPLLVSLTAGLVHLSSRREARALALLHPLLLPVPTPFPFHQR